MNLQFEAQIEHNETTIAQLYKTTKHTYDKKKVLLFVTVGIFMVVMAVTLNFSNVIKGALIIIGCSLLIFRDLSSISKADQVAEARSGIFPVIEYRFSDSGVDWQGEGHMRLQYDQFERLVEDKQYLYIFLNRNSACMIDKGKISPGTVDDFKQYIEKKTKSKWRRNKFLLSINLADVLDMLEDMKKK